MGINKKFILLLGIFLCCFLFARLNYAYAAVGINKMISFQSKVVNSDGTNVNDGTYDFVFTIYNGAGSGATNLFSESWTSAALFSTTMSAAPGLGGESLSYVGDSNEGSLQVGQLLTNITKAETVVITSVNTGTNTLGISPTAQAWAVSDTVTNKIYVKKGIFRVAINSLNQNISGVDFNSDTLFLGINFNSDGEAKPRIQMAAAPYAMNAEKVGGTTATQSATGFTLQGGTSTQSTVSFTTSGSTLTLQPGLAGGLTIQSNGVNGLTLDTGGSSNILIGNNNATGVTIGRSGQVINLAGLTNIGFSGTSLAQLDLRGSLGTQPAASISAQSSFAALEVDNSGFGDLFTASKSGASKFTILNSGDVRINNLNAVNCDIKADTTGLLSCGTEIGANGVTMNVFTSDGTWDQDTDVSGLNFAQIIVTGAGGGGGGADTSAGAGEGGGGGGGAGGTTIEMLSSASIGFTTHTVIVGTGQGGGSAAGGNGNDGESSSFGSLTTANGGGGGTGIVTTTTFEGTPGGDGGAATSDGDIETAGGDGDDGVGGNGGAALGGTGGASYWGSGGKGGDLDAGGQDLGDDGVAFGSGGGGAAVVDNVTGQTGGDGADGVVVVMSYTSSGGDLAEWYETKDDVEAGDVVALSQDSIKYDSQLGLQKASILEKAVIGENAVGIVSSSPFQTMGTDMLNNAKHPKPIALAGRVPVKVSDENGKIKTGDLLTVSKTPGVAMRSIKAGITIGRALEESICLEGKVCQVLVLVNTSYSNGVMIKGVLKEEGIDLETIPEGISYGRIVLTKMLQDKEDIVESNSLSEIYTDRVMAGLEIVSPKIMTDELLTNTIESSTGTDINIKLNKDGQLLINNASGEAGIKFDSKGNIYANGLTISGTLIADKIKANQIEGLEYLIRETSQNPTNTGQNQALALSASDSSDFLPDESGDQVNPNMDSKEILSLQGLEVIGLATVSADLRVKGNSLFEGILSVIDTFKATNIIATGLSDFFGIVNFRDDVFFKGRPTFNNDTAGFAVIKKNAQYVDVHFIKEYENTPVINANIAIDLPTKIPGQTEEEFAKVQQEGDDKLISEQIRFLITRKTNKGFRIVMEKPATDDISFSWLAIAVDKSIKAESAEQPSPTQSPIPTVIAPAALEILPEEILPSTTL